MISRAIPASIHGAIETIAAPALIVAPLLLGFGTAATLISGTIGVLLLGLALQVEGPRRAVPLSAHAGFDYMLAIVASVGGLTVGLASGEWNAAAFLVGVGIAMVMLTASTRFSMPRGA